MIRVALIVNDIVQQIAAWDGVALWDHPLGMTGVELFEDEKCQPGDLYNPLTSPRFTTPPEE